MPLSQAAEGLIGLQRGGSYSLARDALKHRVYDSRVFATTVSDFTFFSQPVGAPWRIGTKTLSETNMYDNGKLPNGQVFLITRMGIACISFMTSAGVVANTASQSFLNLLHSSTFEIKIQGREFDYQIPGAQFVPMPIANFGLAAAANGHRIGDMIASGWTNLDPTPIVVDQLVGFSVVHRMANPDTNITTVLNAAATVLNTANSTMMVILEGLLTRAK